MMAMHHVLALCLIVSAMYPPLSALAQGTAPQVAVTYPGDTDETIRRRIQWIEGAKKEQKLVWWGTQRLDRGQIILSEFNKIYPFIKLEYWRGTGEEIAAKIEAHAVAGRIDADVVLGGEPYNYPRWRKMGIIEKFIDIVPHPERLDKRAYSRYGDWAIPGNNAIAPQYNSRLVPAAEAPKNWIDLLDPKWKGQIGLTTDLKLWTVLALTDGGWGIEKTEMFLDNLSRQSLIWARGHGSTRTMVIAGEFKIDAENYIPNLLSVQDQGAPLDWCRVNPVVITGTSVTLQGGAPHPYAARLFLEWLFSPPGMVVYEKTTNFGAVYPGSATRLARVLEGSHYVYRTEDVVLREAEIGLMDRFARILKIVK